MKPFPKDRFKIGDWVVVDAIVKFKGGQADRRLLSTPVLGQIVGVALRCHGVHCSYPAPRYYEGGPESSHLKVSETEYVWLVRRGMTNKPLEVLNDNVERGTYLLHEEIPFRYIDQSPHTDQSRAYLRDMMKGVPRDAKGRWLKENE